MARILKPKDEDDSEIWQDDAGAEEGEGEPEELGKEVDVEMTDLEEIESKLENGEEISPVASETSMLMKGQVIYSCPRCNKIYFKGKWIKDTVTDIYTVRTELAYCDKCLGKISNRFIASVELYDKNLKEKKAAILERVKRVEAELEQSEKFEKIIEIAEKEGILYFFTNTTRLAAEISRAIRREWHGALQYEWFERNQFLRTKWFANLRDRDSFDKQARTARANRFGMFSFEEEWR